jgi:hypothetical protein
MKTCERICKQCNNIFICIGAQIGNKQHCDKKCANLYKKEYAKQIHIKKYKKNWVESNRDLVRINGNKAYLKASQKPSKRILFSLRSRLRFRLKNTTLSSSKTAIKYLGCSLEELKTHLESLFKPNMNWDNYGKYGWHIDHVKPLSNFDLTDENQLKIVCRYTNLQPLWAEENLKKGNRQYALK